MSYNYLNESFDDKFSKMLESYDDVIDDSLRSHLIAKVQELNLPETFDQNDFPTIKQYEYALEDGIEEYYPDESWWDSIKFEDPMDSIFIELMQNCDVNTVIDIICANDIHNDWLDESLEEDSTPKDIKDLNKVINYYNKNKDKFSGIKDFIKRVFPDESDRDKKKLLSFLQEDDLDESLLNEGNDINELQSSVIDYFRGTFHNSTYQKRDELIKSQNNKSLVPTLNVYIDKSASWGEKQNAIERMLHFLSPLEESRRVSISIKYFSGDKVYSSESDVYDNYDGRTDCLESIINDIHLDAPDCVMIVTDSDMDYYRGFTPTKVTVPGAAWLVFFNEQSKKVIESISGKELTKVFLYNEGGYSKDIDESLDDEDDTLPPVTFELSGDYEPSVTSYEENDLDESKSFDEISNIDIDDSNETELRMASIISSKIGLDTKSKEEFGKFLLKNPKILDSLYSTLTYLLKDETY